MPIIVRKAFTMMAGPAEPPGPGGLFEGDADAFFLAPRHLAGAAGVIRGNHKHEFLGDTERTGDIQRCAARRQVSHDTVDRSAMELDGSGFQGAAARCGSLVVHALFWRDNPKFLQTGGPRQYGEGAA
jgi:hypothetical protein